MPLYAVSYRIHADAGAQRRRDSLVEALKAALPEDDDHNWWDETTSFVLMRSAEASAQAISDRILEGSLVDEETDIVLVIGLDVGDYGGFGPLRDGDGLTELMERLSS